ncbi:hypothetical protein QBC35DRAFT_145654 [Podospora australis]|uniref:Uncharacterized protein n=1 Tax=Podospora australis TaxID=1536484 RepID=A0AAN6X0M9_9PEZI|nr:hypothetical protein QBC35DRAFT_145654 [Podospora australis]
MAAATAIDASLEDFAPPQWSPRRPKSPFGFPSTHSGFRSDGMLTESEGEEEDLEASAGGYSPPAWRRLGNGNHSSGFWKTSESRMSERMMKRENSPDIYAYDSTEDDYHLDDEILQQAIRTRLPRSSSPELGRSPEPEQQLRFFQAPGPSGLDETLTGIKQEEDFDAKMDMSTLPEYKDDKNYMRFAVNRRTEAIETALNFIRRPLATVMGSRRSFLRSLTVVLLSYGAIRFLSQPASLQPAPDLVKVAGLARNLEPLIYYATNGAHQVHQLQATGVAVWDLSESIRTSNLTSAPIIAHTLDEISTGFDTLAIELTKFFAHVDGDIGDVLATMDWGRRELSKLSPSSSPGGSVAIASSSAFDNIHNLLTAAGLLEDTSTGSPTRLGVVLSSVFGPSTPQLTKETLHRVFNELVIVLEDAVSSELQQSLALFALFEAIESQFRILRRTIARESSWQNEHHADFLSSMWTRLLGPKASEVVKYQRNKLLLENLGDTTITNKEVLVDHNRKLLALKASLENIRRKLASPLVRSVNSSTLSLDEQIRGLEDIAGHLATVRTMRNAKVMEMLYGGAGGVRYAKQGGGVVDGGWMEIGDSR